MAYWWIRSVGRTDFDASHRWRMPGIICPRCRRTWARTGPALPSVSFEGDPLGEQLNRWPVALGRWKELAKAVRPYVPESEAIVPGLTFGPLEGELYRSFRLGWHGSGGLVLSASLQRAFAKLAPGLSLVPADLGVPEKYLEVEVRSGAIATSMRVASPCSECGFREQRLKDDRLVIGDVRADLPPIFRLRNYPAAVLVQEVLLPLFRRELGDEAELVEVRIWKRKQARRNGRRRK